MGVRETKNLGLIKAIHTGVNPPLNTKIIWYDDNVGVKIHKVYDIPTSAWKPLGNGQTVNGIYTYLGYATDSSGANFNLTKQATSTHWAVITSDTPKTSTELTATLFEGRWTAYDGAATGGGNFTYVGFADSEAGENFGSSPKYEVTVGVFAYRKFMGVVTFDSPQIYGAALFSGKWAPIIQENTGGNYDQDIIDLYLEIDRVETQSTNNFNTLNSDYTIFKSDQQTYNTNTSNSISTLDTKVNQAVSDLQTADANSIKRENHTGVQPISSVTNLAETLATLLVGIGVKEIEYLTQAAYDQKVTAGTTKTTTVYLTPKAIV